MIKTQGKTKGIRQKGRNMNFSETIDKCLSQSVKDEEKDNTNTLRRYNVPKKERTYKTLVACKLVDLALEGDYKAVNLITSIEMQEEARQSDPFSNIF